MEKTSVFTGPADLAIFATTCSNALLAKAQHTFILPSGCSKESWPVEEIKKQNAKLLSELRHQGNVYALFIRERNEKSKWRAMYVGERKADGLRSRITEHLIKKDKQTGSKLAEIQDAVAKGFEIGISFIRVEPQSLRLFVEETIIASNKSNLPWNTQG